MAIFSPEIVFTDLDVELAFNHTDAQLLTVIDAAIAKAAGYALETEKCVFVFAHLMLRHGEDFDIDPERPWAMNILANKPEENPEKTAERLYDASAEHHEQ